MSNEQELLIEILDTLRRLGDSSDKYFSQIGEREIINPFQDDVQIGTNGNKQSMPSGFLDELGIRSLTINIHSPFDFPKGFALPYNENLNQHKWHRFRDTSFLTNLKIALKDCRVITFLDWTIVNGASQLWGGFLSDVIRPLDRKDMNFIFSLGYPEFRPTHEVDEIIDIISDFSIHGKVTFLLNESEALKLWMVLHGQESGVTPFNSRSVSLTEKYRSIYNTMRIDRLLIYSMDRVTVFSDGQQLEIKGRPIANHKISQVVKDNFNAGYSLGLLLNLDISHCTVLGRAVSGAYLENQTHPDQKALLSYIERWIGELESVHQVSTKKELSITQ